MNDIVFKTDPEDNVDCEDLSSIGFITSGCYSPHTNKPISMGYIHLDESDSSFRQKYKNYVRDNKRVNIETKGKINEYKPSLFPLI